MTTTRVMTIMLPIAALGIGLAVTFGETPLPVGRAIGALFGYGSTADVLIVQGIRLPRALAAMLAGAGLGASGAALQGLFRNPLADPATLGVSASATFASTALVYFGAATAIAWALPLASIAGAVLGTLVLLQIVARTNSITALLLAGLAFSTFIGALMTLLLNFAPTPFTLSDLVNWTLGSVANRTMGDVWLAAPLIGAGLAILARTGTGLSRLTLGAETATSLGTSVKRLQRAVVLGTGLATGASVALAGAVGFVGIIAPHLIRPYTAHHPGRTILPSALLGGIILIYADLLIRVLPTPFELKLGVLAALIGAPIFVLIVMQRSRHDD